MTDLIPCVDVPEGEISIWKVERFTVAKEDVMIHNLRCTFKAGMGNRTIRPGIYTRLMRGSSVIMSDTDAEKRDHISAVRAAKGLILLNGLGLGMVLNACLLKPEVEKAIVVERSQEVIELCGSHYCNKFGNKINIVHDDAMTFKPSKRMRFSMVWHDIWDYICEDNLEQMKALHRKYGRRADWQGSWCRELCSMNL